MGITDKLREMTDELDNGMGELGWVRLPVDADGKPIRVVDTLDGYGKTTVVRGLTLRDDGWSMTCENGPWFNFAAFTHHHAPTVEEVMREFTDAVLEWAGKNGTVAEVGTWSDVASEYAAKLRLASDEKEQE